MDPHDLVNIDLIGDLENLLEDLRRRWPHTLAAMVAGSLSDEAEECLDAYGERLYAFLSNLDNDYSELFKFSEVEVAEYAEVEVVQQRPQAG